MPPEKPDLTQYREKRSGDGTPEPMGEGLDTRTRVFALHKHNATRLHWDLRLEWEGVLLSWAIPRGPTHDPKIKRLAVQTEPHPLEYVDFEGVIPKGNYGAGEMILWDRGVWTPIDEEQYTWEQKILFELQGFKVRGRFALIKTRRSGGSKDEWLLIKKDDAFARPGVEDDSFDQGSIISGLTIEDLAAGSSRADAIRADLTRAAVPARTVSLSAFEPQNARRGNGPFSDPDWLFEVKYDGFRVIAEKNGSSVRLRYRSGRDATAVFPEIVQALSRQPFNHLLIDAEAVVLDGEGRPSFQRLQKRAQLKRHDLIQSATVQLPAVLYCFDLVAIEGYDLRDLPLIERKAYLRRVLPESGPLRFSDHFEEHGELMFEHVAQLGLEGIMAKRKASRYLGKRTDDWLKIKNEHTDNFLVVGYTAAETSICLARREGDVLRYAGRVGSGLSDEKMAELKRWLKGTEVPDCPVGREPGDGRWGRKDVRYIWVQPRLMVEVQFTETTDDGHLRHPVYLRLRLDESFVDDPTESGPLREVPYTNRDKLFWHDEGYTKGDLIDYYLAVAPWLLPLLEDRPLVLTRYPDGPDGKSFFQKDAPSYLPSWVRRQRMYSEQTKNETNYLIADCPETLGYIANMASIPLHVWSSRSVDLQHPDWCIIDLDPKEAPFAHVIQIALAVRALCEEIGLPSFIKTSGATGLHVLLPLARMCTYQQCRDLAMLIARAICRDLGDIATVERALQRRDGKVYIDTLQNGHGRLIVSAYCVRPRPGAPVSTPLLWEEVTETLEPRDYTIKNVPQRLVSLGFEPLTPILDSVPDLLGALEKLSVKLT
ncbi:MAG: bifunctional non-homologous end joining protein LigD [Myxococcota bacterium]|jgi:bifunctional non-homologous end joining protein LigD